MDAECKEILDRPIYVLGFMFNRHLSEVVLILKNRPAWQAGLFNGIGGHVEGDELLTQAMAREFLEETGCKTAPLDWQRCLRMDRLMESPRFIVYVLRCIADMDSVRDVVRTNGDQQVFVAQVANLPTSCVSNLPWLIGMLADLNPGDCPSYQVQGQIGDHRATRPTFAPSHQAQAQPV